MLSLPWLSILIFWPLTGILFLVPFHKHYTMNAYGARFVALFFTITTFFLSVYIAWQFDSKLLGFQFQEKVQWLSSWNISYELGLDGLGLLFVLLSTFLMPLAILVSWNAIDGYVKEYMAAFLLLESLMLGVFCVLDFFLFYIFFEAVLIPMFLIIGIWGGKNRVYASFKFFLYTLLGSVFMLLAMLYMYDQLGSASLINAVGHVFSSSAQNWLWLAFFFSFAVKVPMWPLHTWLPDAHVEAPTAGSVILAGVLLKMGGYGFLRFSLPMFPEATTFFAPWVIGLSLIAIIYTSVIALVQKDIKKLIAYSSVAHMGFVTLGLFSLTPHGISGAIIQMISHGLISGAIFLAIGVIYERLHTRDIESLGGLVQSMPRYAFFLLIYIFASIGFPGTTGFIGEFLVLLGTFIINPLVAAIAASAMVLGAAYGLWFYRKVMFGEKSPLVSQSSIIDISHREITIFIPLTLGIILLGIYPSPLLSVIEPVVYQILKPYGY